MNLLARRKLTNRVALTLSLSAMAFGLFWLICLSSSVSRGIPSIPMLTLCWLTAKLHPRLLLR